MANIDNSYLNLPATPVKSFADFMGSGLQEIPRLNALVTAIKSVFKVQDTQIQLYFIEGRRYAIDIFTTRRKNQLVSTIYYLPSVNQLHIYDSDRNLLIASEKKKIIYSAIPFTLDYIGAADKLRNIISSI